MLRSTLSTSSLRCVAALGWLAICADAGMCQDSTLKDAKPPASLGNLTCTLGEDVQTETSAGQAQAILCVFRGTAANTEELYVGTAYFSGSPDARKDGAALSWIVKGPEGAISAAGGLEQTYTAQADADNDGASTLAGKEKSSEKDAITLHPLALLDGDSKKPPEVRRVAVIELRLKTTTA